MTLFLSLLISLALGVILVFAWRSIPVDPSGAPLRTSTVLFALWLIASALFGPRFLVYSPPGFFDITIERALFALLMMIMIIGLFTGRYALIRNYSIEVTMLLFVIICVASMLRSGFLSPEPERFPGPWFVFITGYFFPFIVFVFAKNFLTDDQDLTVVLHALFYFGTYLTIIAFFEFFHLRQYVYPQYINDPEFVLHLDRARGPFLNSGLNGMAILFGFLAGLHLFFQKQGLIQWAYLFFLSLYFPAIFFTQTRSVYLSFLIVLVALFIFYRTPFPKMKVLALPIAFLLIFMALESPRFMTGERRTGGILQVTEVVVRFQLLDRSLQMIANNPLFGVGLAQFIPESFKRYRGRGAVAESADEQTQHNHLMGLMVELGLTGILVYLGVLALVFKRIIQARKIIPETGLIGTNFMLISALIWAVYLNTNLFLEPSYFLFINAVPFMFAGMADRLFQQHALA